MKRMVCAVALATGTGAILGSAPQQASADPVPATQSNGLQLSIATPSLVSSTSGATLDVNYRGGALRSIELYVDNTKVFRKTVRFAENHGNFNLKVDGSALAEGDHDVMVVAVDSEGNSATSTLKVHVSGPEIDGIAQFAYPRRNAMVQKVVPIELKLDSDIKSPYVAYSIDNDFIMFRNYAPYVYNWDTTRVSDGPHTIGVEVYDSVTQDLLKKMTIQVIVKNVGGYTTIQPAVPTISSATNAIPMRAIIGEAIAEPIAKVLDDSAALSHTQLPVGPLSLRDIEPTSSVLPADPTIPRSIIPVPAPERVTSHNAAVAGKAAAAPVAHPAVLPRIEEMVAEPEPLETTVSDNARISRITVTPSKMGNAAARPGIASPAPALPQPVMIARYAVPPAPRIVAAHRPAWVHTFQVAMNRIRVAFDVQPRITNGMPLTPFRAIFEQSGGTVTWYGKSHTVRAVSGDRQIEFRIGDRTARVNNKVLKLAYAPFVESGRTIVPLTFVRDAMNVNVTYDAKQGQVNIDSQRR